jgi:hypothetical protein
MLINTSADLQASTGTAEGQAFLQALLDDYTTFDDAEYPEGYDRGLGPDDEGYVEPVLRQEWNAGAAASWGFGGREQIEAALIGE